MIVGCEGCEQIIDTDVESYVKLRDAALKEMYFYHLECTPDPDADYEPPSHTYGGRGEDEND